MEVGREGAGKEGESEHVHCFSAAARTLLPSSDSATGEEEHETRQRDKSTDGGEQAAGRRELTLRDEIHMMRTAERSSGGGWEREREGQVGPRSSRSTCALGSRIGLGAVSSIAQKGKLLDEQDAKELNRNAEKEKK